MKRKNLYSSEQSITQRLGQAGFLDLALRRADVVFDAAEEDLAHGRIINHITGAPVAIARLPDRADINEIMNAALHLEIERTLEINDAPGLGIDLRHMRVAAKTKRRRLHHEMIGGLERRIDVEKFLGLEERRMDDEKMLLLAEERQLAQIILFRRGKMAAE